MATEDPEGPCCPHRPGSEHMRWCPQRCQNDGCGGDPDGPYACRCAADPIVIETAATFAGQYKQAQLAKACAAVELDQVKPTPGAAYWVTASNGVTKYLVDRAEQLCSCPAGQNGRLCYHLAAVDIAVAVAQLTDEEH